MEAQERLFRAAVALKGLDGLVELVAAVVLLGTPAAFVREFVEWVLTRDLLGPPDGSLARHFIAGTTEFASGNRTFAVVYLGLHGLLKIAMAVALLKEWLRAYPLVIAVLAVFVAYELHRAVNTGSIVLPVLAALDLLIIVLVAREYRALRRKRRDSYAERP
ncbi:Uncharacterized membrane protein [Pseudonocardia thermophila]|uniref:Uncharacterized membrane protein n=1 Tax=Pseudonocardia thermophila TaxID=1848 RepID=A0A1M6WVS4_PSETH|nr:DUF2127 domain-containing protein [Pseudonocardia thermophila]SHK97669.1 Uncharacterized membrane protein [Pseudonocardia thermophila]